MICAAVRAVRRAFGSAEVLNPTAASAGPDDPRLAALVRELSVHDREFREWWAARHVASQRFGTKTLRHPIAGEITLGWDSFSCAPDSEQQLIVWTAEPDTPSHQALRFLAAWAADPSHAAPDTVD